MSDNIVPIIDPAQPSAIEHLNAICTKASISAQHPIWVECITVAISLSIALGSYPYFSHISCLFWGAFVKNLNTPNGLPNSIKPSYATSCAISYMSLSSVSIPHKLANAINCFGSFFVYPPSFDVNANVWVISLAWSEWAAVPPAHILA